MATATWIPPLPSGWEGRWDPNQRAYFFINHNDKSTSWEDPRFRPAQAQPPPAQHHAGHGQSGSSHGAAAAQALSHHGHQQKSKGETIPLDTMHVQHGSKIVKGAYNPEAEESSSDSEWENEEDFDALFSSSQVDHVDREKIQKIKQMYPYAPEEFIRTSLSKNNNDLAKACMEVTKAGYRNYGVKQQDNQEAALNRLKAMYPTADHNLIKDVLTQCQNNESKARLQLEDIGYKPTSHYTATPRRSPTPSPRPGTRQQQQQQQRQPSPARAVSPKRTSPPKISEAEKNRVKTKIKSEFPSHEITVINMALEAVQFNEDKARSLMQKWSTSPASRATSASSQRSHTDAAASSSATHSLEPVSLPASTNFEPAPLSATSLEPVDFKDDDSFISRPSTSSTANASSARSTPVRTTPTRGSPHRSASPATPASKKSTSSTPDRTGPSTTQQNRAKQVTHTNQRQRTPSRPVVSQPTIVPFSHITRAQGPNPALRHGPDKKLLLSEYTQAKGPNPDLRSGPDRSRVQGSQGAYGPDRSLRCGPQDDLWKGSNPNMLQSRALETHV